MPRAGATWHVDAFSQSSPLNTLYVQKTPVHPLTFSGMVLSDINKSEWKRESPGTNPLPLGKGDISALLTSDNQNLTRGTRSNRKKKARILSGGTIDSHMWLLLSIMWCFCLIMMHKNRPTGQSRLSAGHQRCSASAQIGAQQRQKPPPPPQKNCQHSSQDDERWKCPFLSFQEMWNLC